MTSSPRRDYQKGDRTIFLSIRQLAERWQCSDKKVSRLIKKRALPAYKNGGEWRIREVDALAYERSCLY